MLSEGRQKSRGRPSLALGAAGVMIAVALVSPAHAQRKGDCSTAAISRARAAARKQANTKQFVRATEVLQAASDACGVNAPDENDPAQARAFYWMQSDLALMLLKAGRPVDCLSLLAPLLYPGPASIENALPDDDGGVGAAISHNQGLCQAAQDKAHADFMPTACPLSKQDDAWLLSTEGGGTACLARLFEPGKSDRDADGFSICPATWLLRSDEKGRVRRSRLQVTDGPLEDSSFCCAVDQVSIARRDDRVLVRITGGGRDCNGGTASSRLDSVYEWRGDKLILREDNDVGEH